MEELAGKELEPKRGVVPAASPPDLEKKRTGKPETRTKAKRSGESKRHGQVGM